MKTFAATSLAILACIVGILPLFDNVNGAGFKLTSADGKYIPGSILVWEGVIDKLKQFTDSAGYESLQLWRNQVKPADEALIKGDLDSAANVLQKAIIHARALIPYVKSEFLQNKLKKSVASAERMVKIIEAKTGALQDLQTFSETESSSLEN